MLATIFKPSIDNATVKQLVSHMLQTMNYAKYRDALYLVETHPDVPRKFVALEYTHSPFDATVLQAEYVPGSRVPIHNILQHPDFRSNMIRLFGDVNFYTRRKLDYTKPFGPEQLTNTRQLVVVVNGLDEDYSDMPPLVSRAEVLNPEPDDDMPSLIPVSQSNDTQSVPSIPSYNNYIQGGLNNTIWSPLPNTYAYANPV